MIGAEFNNLLEEEKKDGLIPKEAEIRLAKLIEKGKEAEEFLKTGNFGSLSKVKTLRIIKQGKQAREKLINGSLRFVVGKASRYIAIWPTLELKDLIGDGNIGLIKAADTFDWKRGCRFRTYAAWTVRQSISRSLFDKAREIRIPVYLVESLNRLKKAKKKLRQELSREPTYEELAETTKETVAKIKELEEQAELLPGVVGSLSQDMGKEGEEEGFNLIAITRDEKAEDPKKVVARKLLKESLCRVVASSLRAIEREVVIGRFGLDGDNPRSLDEIGKAFGLCRERVRQIERDALKKLRDVVPKDWFRDL